MALLDLIDLADELESKRVRFGWPKTAHYPDGTPVALVAMVQEFGSHDTPFPIPARPFIRPAIVANKETCIQMLKDGIKQVLRHENSIDSVLDAVGASYASEIQSQISDVTAPALSHATLVLRRWKDKDANFKGSITKVLEAQASTEDLGGVPTKPLVDSGYMLATVTSMVEDK